MNTRELDLPLEDTPSSRFLLWIIVGLVYLTVLALALAAVADGTLGLLDQRPRIVTVALPAAEPGRADGELGSALALLRATDGVAAASPVAADGLEDVAGPWPGAAEAGDDLPVPRLIDVTFEQGRSPDVEALQARLREVVAGASIEVEQPALLQDDELARLLRLGGGAVGFALLLGILVVVVVVTRMSLDLHDDTVDLLRLMGAADGYVARQFELHALARGLRGGLIGFAAGVLTLLALLHGGHLSERLAALPLDLRPVDWVLLACVPVVAAMLISITARLTAQFGLARLRWPRHAS